MSVPYMMFVSIHIRWLIFHETLGISPAVLSFLQVEYEYLRVNFSIIQSHYNKGRIKEMLDEKGNSIYCK